MLYINSYLSLFSTSKKGILECTFNYLIRLEEFSGNIYGQIQDLNQSLSKEIAKFMMNQK